MPSQELDANEDIRFRRFEESDVFDNADGHMTITGEHESGITSRIRVPLDEVQPEIERYAEEAIGAIVEDKRAEFHDFVRSRIEASVDTIEGVTEDFLDELEDELDLTEPESEEEPEQTSHTIEQEEEVDTTGTARAETADAI